MSAIIKKLKYLEASMRDVERFVAEGGDPKSQAAAPIWMNLMGAFESLAGEFGYEMGKPTKKVSSITAHSKTAGMDLK